jgi:hypothetical protein
MLRERSAGDVGVTDVEDDVTSSRAAQGLPPRVADPVVLGKIATLLDLGDRAAL